MFALFKKLKKHKAQEPSYIQGFSRIDIGCGSWKEEGYFGVDRFTGPQVDYVLDLERDPLPFPDSSIEHAVTYHALEHVNNLERLVGEVWRVLKPNAQFFVCVPYYNSHINMANIYHVRAFNEHTFRFFTSEPTTSCMPEHLWKFPFTPAWGLKGSDNMRHDVEFRCLKIEYDYFPAYKKLSETEKETKRLAHFNVAHNICFYLQALKSISSIIELTHDEIIIPSKRKWMIENDF